MSDFNQTYGGWLGLDEERRAFDLLTDSHGELFTDLKGLAERLKPRLEDEIRKHLIAKLMEELPIDSGFMLWAAQNKVFIDSAMRALLAPGPQDIGNCVAYAAALCIALSLAQEIFLTGDPEAALVPYIPWLYGIGRVYVGGNRIRGDGSLGTWQIEAVHKYGVLWADEPGLPGPLPEGSASVGRAWGSQKVILDKWKDRAVDYPVGQHTEIKSFDDLWNATVDLQQSWTIASDQGFRDGGVDSRYGIRIWRPSGNWGHQMHGRGCFEIKGQRFAEVGNQWGFKYHKQIHPAFPEFGSFAVAEEDFDRWVKKAFCCTYEGVTSRSIAPPSFNLLGVG